MPQYFGVRSIYLSANVRVHNPTSLTEVFCLQAPSLEARELWKGYIYSVVEVSDGPKHF